jgi:hypothetical protein
MVIIKETQPILSVLQKADELVVPEDLGTGYKALIVEVSSDDPRSRTGEVEGTLLFFPGVTAEQLLRG